MNQKNLKHAMIHGTVILTLAGVATRIIGFIYKIYLADIIGAKALGIYQLVFPIFSVCFTIYAAGIQTAVSQLVGATQGRADGRDKVILKQAIVFSLLLAFVLSFLIYGSADFIAKNIMQEPACADCLRILPILFPFCAVSCCIHGYFYGKSKASTPAASQFIEQLGRVGFVFLMATLLGKQNRQLTCEYAVMGLVAGEVAANLFNLLSLFYSCRTEAASIKASTKKFSSHQLFNEQLLRLALPLTGTRLVTAVLTSLEAILIPSMLRKYGLSQTNALSVYGILTGMSIPFILFPSTFTNSLSVLLLPAIAEAHAAGREAKIKRAVSTSIKYSLLIGLLFTCVFIVFGNAFGTLFFHNQTAGYFMVILSWLCPFLYLSTTLGSIINGLGKTHLTFRNTVTGLCLRIILIAILIPKNGISGYLFALLISQLMISLLDFLVLRKACRMEFDSAGWIAIPSLFLIILGFCILQGSRLLLEIYHIPMLLLLPCSCLLLCGLYVLLLYYSGIISLKDIR